MKTRIKKALHQELDKLQSTAAWQDADGSYHLLNDYQIILGDYVQVLQNGQERHRFNRRRAAVAWCVADHVGDKTLAFTVIQIDGQITRTQDDIQTRQSLVGDQDFRDRVRIKLQHKQERYQQLQSELDRCVRLAKFYKRGLSQ